MSLSVQIELSDDDLKFFKDTLEKAKNTAAMANQETILKEAEELLNIVENTNKLPEFIKARFQQLHVLIDMLTNKDWDIPENERTEILNVLAYFTNSYHLIPDNIPGIGYLDEAILVDLVVKDIFTEYKNYIEYQHYCKLEAKVHHNHHVSRADWEEHNRVSMYQRMRNRSHSVGSIF